MATREELQREAEAAGLSPEEVNEVLAEFDAGMAERRGREMTGGEAFVRKFNEASMPGTGKMLSTRRALDPSLPHERQMMLGMMSPGGVWPFTQIRRQEAQPEGSYTENDQVVPVRPYQTEEQKAVAMQDTAADLQRAGEGYGGKLGTLFGALTSPLNKLGAFLGKGAVKGSPVLSKAPERVQEFATGAVSSVPYSAAQSVAEGDDVQDSGIRAFFNALTGGTLNTLLAQGGRIASAGRASVDKAEEMGPELGAARKHGYELGFGGTMKPPKDTGLSPGTKGIAEQAGDKIAPLALSAVKKTEEEYSSLRGPEYDEFFSRPEMQKRVSSRPIIDTFAKFIKERVYSADGKPISESMANRLRQDVRDFATFRAVPIKDAERVARETGGVAVPYEAVGPGQVTGAGIRQPRKLGAVEPEGTVSEPIEPGELTKTHTAVPRGSYKAQNPDPGFPKRKSNLTDEFGQPIEVEVKPVNPPPMSEQPRFVAGKEGVMEAGTRGEIARKGSLPSPGSRSEAPSPRGKGTEEAGSDYIPPVPKGKERQYALVMIPRQLNAFDLENVRNVYDDAGKIAKEAKGDSVPLQAVANTARGMRKQFGSGTEIDEFMATQEGRINSLSDLKAALGIRGPINPDSKQQIMAVRQMLERYGTRENKEFNEVLADLGKRSPELRPELDKLEGMVSAEFVRTHPPAKSTIPFVPDTRRTAFAVDPILRRAETLRREGAPRIAAPAGAAAGDWIRKRLEEKEEQGN